MLNGYTCRGLGDSSNQLCCPNDEIVMSRLGVSNSTAFKVPCYAGTTIIGYTCGPCAGPDNLRTCYPNPPEKSNLMVAEVGDIHPIDYDITDAVGVPATVNPGCDSYLVTCDAPGKSPFIRCRSKCIGKVAPSTNLM
jgi:hypothetical protein